MTVARKLSPVRKHIVSIGVIAFLMLFFLPPGSPIDVQAQSRKKASSIQKAGNPTAGNTPTGFTFEKTTPIGITLTQIGEYQVSGAINLAEWRWNDNDKSWWAYLSTIRITGRTNATWKNFGRTNTVRGQVYEVSDRTRGQKLSPIIIMAKGYSTENRPGRLVLKKKITVDDFNKGFFEFSPWDFHFEDDQKGDEQAESIEFLLTAVPGKSIRLPAISIAAKRLSVPEMAETQAKGAPVKAETIPPTPDSERLPERSNKELSEKPAADKIPNFAKKPTVTEAASVSRKPTVAKKSMAAAKPARGPEAKWYQWAQAKPVLKAYLLPFIADWTPSIFKLSQDKLFKLLAVLGIFFLSAAVFNIYQRDQRKILKRTPGDIEAFDEIKHVEPIEKIEHIYESSFKTFLLLFLSALLISLMIQGLYGTKSFPVQMMIFLAIVGGVVGRRTGILAAFSFTVVLFVANLLIFDLKEKLTIPVPKEDSTIGFIGMATAVGAVCGIWSFFAKDPEKKELLRKAFILGLIFLMLAIHIEEYSPLGIPVFLAISLIWWGLWRAMAHKRILSKILPWLGMAYIHLEKFSRLEGIAGKLAKIKGIDPKETAWIRANIATNNGDIDGAIEILSALEPSKKTDQLLFELYQKRKEFDALEERAALHPRSDAIGMLKKLPKNAERDGIILNLLIKDEKWEEIRKFLQSMNRSAAISRLEKLPQTAQRDLLLVPLLFQDNRHQGIFKVMQAYDARDGVGKLESFLPKGSASDHVIIRFLALRDQWELIRDRIASLQPNTIISHLETLPESDERDLLLAENWIENRGQEALENYFTGKPQEYSVRILEKLDSGLLRDRTLAQVYAKHGRASETVACLDKYFQLEQLGQADLKLLANSYSKLNKPQAAIAVWEKAWAADPHDEETLRSLSKESITAGQMSQFLSDLDDEMLLSLSADTLWALIKYFRHFKQANLTRKAAEVSVDRWKDHRAIFFLGKVLENEKEYRKAAETYAAAGPRGLMPQALCLFRIEDHKAVIPLLRQVEINDENRTAALYHLGFSLYKTGQLEEAYSTFDMLDPHHADGALQKDLTRICIHQGFTAMKHQTYGDAVNYLERGMNHAPADAQNESAAIKEALAVCYYNLTLNHIFSEDDNFDAVNGCIEKARTYRNGPWEELDLLRGLTLLKAMDSEKALQAFSVLSKRHPDNRQYLFHKALAAAAEGKYGYARNILTDLANSEGNGDYRSRSRLLLGAIAIKMGDGKEAEDQVRLALEDI